jgi:hypothetical protein
MNVVGIEARRTLTVVGLREGVYPPRIVGDGKRAVIPNAVLPGRAWGSDAAAAGATAPVWEGDSSSGPWLGLDAADFWTQLYARLVRFLGGLDPSAHGYRAVVAAAGSKGSPAAVAALARTAGFEDVTPISPPCAVLAGWLAARGDEPPGDQVVAVVTIGDTSAEAAAFAVRTGLQPVITAAAEVAALPGVGAAPWTAQVVAEVLGHLSEPAPEGIHLPLWQVALEFGMRLRRAGPRQMVRWFGPLEDRLMSPIRLSAEDFARWPGVSALCEWLPGAVPEATRTLGKSAPDVLLVAGVGAAWPLPARTFSDLPMPTISDDPAIDVALGATWWPRVAQGQAAPTPMTARARIAPRPQTEPLPLAAEGPEPRLEGLPVPELVAVRPSPGPHFALPPEMHPEEWSRLLDQELGGPDLPPSVS